MTPAELEQARRALGLKQRELGDALDMTREHVGRMERGELPIHRTTALAVRYLVARKASD
jgi:transcriptional regulator with XRE-family HTH domain